MQLKKKWDCGEGFIVGKTGKRVPATHLTGKDLIPSGAITDRGIKRSEIVKVKDTLFKTPYTSARFTPPLILIRMQMDLAHAIWTENYLTYKNKAVGVCAKEIDLSALIDLGPLAYNPQKNLSGIRAATSVRMFTQKATTPSEIDILSLPFPSEGTLDISENERILVDDIVDYFREFIASVKTL